jgi:acetyl-CoA carboxylase biotin carboxyl carrier protein
MDLSNKIPAIKELLKLLEDSQVSEIEVEDAGERIKVVKATAGAMVYSAATLPQAALPHEKSAEEKAVADLPAKAAISGKAVKSPMVGTFYRSASPGGRVFVEVGSVVEAGQTLCIIEAMKMMNQIESDHAGVVKAVLVNNGDPVEFDQPLFIVE